MLNKVILVGRLSADPQSKSFTSGKSLCEFTVVTEEGRGEDKKAQFHDIKAFGDLGTTCFQFLKQGRMVALTGMITYKDINGKRYTGIVASEVTFL